MLYYCKSLCERDNARRKGMNHTVVLLIKMFHYCLYLASLRGEIKFVDDVIIYYNRCVAICTLAYNNLKGSATKFDQ